MRETCSTREENGLELINTKAIGPATASFADLFDIRQIRCLLTAEFTFNSG